jgi:hypothetical protein
MKKIFLTFLIVLISMGQSAFVFEARATVSPQIGDIFCQQGVAYFDKDQFPEALVEFKKALLANPESQVAREYIEMIERELLRRHGLLACTQVSKKNLVDLYLSGMEQKRGVPPTQDIGPAAPVCEIPDAGTATRLSSAAAPSASSGDTAVSAVPLKKTAGSPTAAQAPAAKPGASGSAAMVDLTTYESSDITLYVDEPVLLKGAVINRLLVTHPAILQASQPATDEVLLQPREIGNCYLHLWGDNNERKSYKVTIGPRRFEEILAQAAKAKKYEESLPDSFKFTYSISGDSYLTGRGIGDLQRTSHTMAYTSSLKGETPYGMFDTSVQGNRTNLGQYRVSNVRMGLMDAHFDELKDIDIRMFDYGPSFSAFGFPGSELRGVKVDAPMFEKSLNYTAFWGAVPEGDFTFLSPDEGLSKTKKAWLEGVGVSYDVSRFANFKTFYAHSYGPERNEPVLTSDTAGVQMNYDLGVWDFGAGMVSDMTHNSYTAETSFTIPKLRVGLNMTDNAKNFASLLGGVPTTGSTNGTLSINYRPTDSVTIYNAFSGTHDKVFNNPDNPGRPNYNSTTRLNWVLDLHTELEAGYIMDDQVGSNTPAVTETKELMLRKKFFLIRRLSTYLLYQNKKSKNYTSPAQNFNNNRLLGGINFRVLGDVYFYCNQEVNLLRNTFTNETAYPTAREFGLNYNHQIYDTPFYTNLRLFYRDEQDTESTLSFLSGEDRLEGEAELKFKPSAGNEAFVKLRIDNVWAERTGVDKHFDVDLSWGIRLLWDTGLRWQSVGGFCGFVFYDTNGDGIKQPQEGGVPGAKIVVNGKQNAVTDRDGYYRLTGVSGKTAMLSLDLATIPQGYNPTVSAERKVDIVHATNKRYDFGLATRMEISGLVFYDKNKNGTYDAGEETLKGIVLVLDGTTKTATNLQGTYMFRKFSPGEHTITIDLKSVPVKYIPKVAIRKSVNVLEGTTFVFNVPLELQATPSVSSADSSRQQEKYNVSATFVR